MKKKKIIPNSYIIFVFLFLYLPIFVLVFYSFNTSRLNILFEGFTLDWYRTLFHNQELLEALRNTLIVTFVSTTISTIIGTISAIGLHNYNFKGKNWINQLLYIPVVIPEIVLGIALLSVYTLLKLDLGLTTLILSHIAFSIPFVIISVRSVMDTNIDQMKLAAADLGASPSKIFWHITLPSVMPGVTSGALLAVTLSLDDVVISYFTAGPGSNTLPLKLFAMIKTGVTPDVNALTTLMLLVIIAILGVFTIYQTRRIKKVKFYE